MAGVGAEAAEAAKQLFVWQFAGQIIEALLGPGFAALTQQVNDITPVAQLQPTDLADAVARGFMPHNAAADSARRSGLENDKFDTLIDLATVRLSPADLAAAVLRGFLSRDDATAQAAPSGINAEHFATLLQLAQAVPPLATAAAAARLGIIPDQGTADGKPSFEGAAQQSRIPADWWPILKDLSRAYPTPNDILNAYLEGQVDEAKAKQLYEQLGGVPEYFQLLFDSNGTAPTPDMAGTMANRGIIPWDGTGPESVSFEQAFLEGPWRNKWSKPMRQLMEYLPPPRTVTAMFHEGTLTKQQATDLLVKQGLTAELAAAYVTSGSSQKTAKAKDLTETQVIALYEAQLVAEADAESMLGALGFDPDNAQYLLKLADLRRAISALNTAVSRVHTLYVGHKISRAVVQDTLTKLGVPTGQVSDILATWDLEAAVNVRLPTESQVVDAWHLTIIDQDKATAELVRMGYSAHDAWLLLSIKNKAPLPGEPPDSPTPLGQA